MHKHPSQKNKFLKEGGVGGGGAWPEIMYVRKKLNVQDLEKLYFKTSFSCEKNIICRIHFMLHFRQPEAFCFLERD